MAQTYAFWAEQLERFASGNDAVLDELAVAGLAWQPGVAERVSTRIAQAFTTRLEEMRRRLQRDLDVPSGDIGQIGQALVGAKRGIAPLMRLATLPSLPVEVRDHLSAELQRVIKDVQSALERSARPDTDGGVRILAELRRHSLTSGVYAGMESAAAQPLPAASGPRPLIL